jgi:hypothetical protein
MTIDIHKHYQEIREQLSRLDKASTTYLIHIEPEGERLCISTNGEKVSDLHAALRILHFAVEHYIDAYMDKEDCSAQSLKEALMEECETLVDGWIEVYA